MSFLFASFWVKIIQATTMIDFLKTIFSKTTAFCVTCSSYIKGKRKIMHTHTSHLKVQVTHTNHKRRIILLSYFELVTIIGDTSFSFSGLDKRTEGR